MARDNPLWNELWDSKISHPENIQVPAYVVGSWCNPVHVTGTLRAFQKLPASTPKWLRVHNSLEWPDFYGYQHDLRRFFDYYLHGKITNGWDTTPPVRLCVLDFGNSEGDTVNRAESEWPLARTKYVKYYLGREKTMSLAEKGSIIVVIGGRGE